MKKLPFLLFFLPVLSCKNATTNQLSNGKEFEGVITYRITYDGYPEDYSYGDTMRFWYSKGNCIKEYNGKAIHGVRKEIFLIKGNRYFVQMVNGDSLLTTDVTSDKFMSLKDSHHSFTETRILGHTCEQIDQDLEYTKGHLPCFVSLLYSKEVLPVDKQNFKNVKFSCFDRFIDESGAFYLSYFLRIQDSNKDAPSSYKFTAINIREQPVDPSIFNIDTSRIKPIFQ